MRARPDGRLRRLGVEAVVALRDVDDDGDTAGLGHRLDGRDERGGWNDHLVARLEPGSEEAKAERIEPTGHADAVVDAAVVGERPLEGADRRPVRESARVEEPADLTQQLLLERRVGGREIEKRHRDAGLRYVHSHAVTLDPGGRAHYRTKVQHRRRNADAGRSRRVPHRA